MVDIHRVMKSRCSRVHLFLGANTSVMSLMMANPYVHRGACASATESTVASSIMACFIEGSIALCPRCHKILRAVLGPTFGKISTLESESLPETCSCFSTLTVLFHPARLRFLVEGGFKGGFNWWYCCVSGFVCAATSCQFRLYQALDHAFKVLRTGFLIFVGRSSGCGGRGRWVQVIISFNPGQLPFVCLY